MHTTIQQTWEFGRSGDAGQIQVHGWSGGEDGFTWTEGRRANLCIETPEAPHGFFLELSHDLFTVPPRIMGQPVTIGINDRHIRTVELRRAGMIAVFCPPPRPGDRRLSITFDFPQAMRPCDVIASHDPREIAIAFRRLRVLALTEPPAPRGGGESRIMLTGRSVETLSGEIERITGRPVDEVLTRFEMVAGKCDMGLVQRAFGLEPLSLLRFAGSNLTLAVNGLDNGFAGIGEQLTAHISKDDDKEWMISDGIGLNYHSGQYSHNTTAEQTIERERRKIAFLLRKLNEDLAEHHKIFVHDDQAGASLEEVLPLFLALRRRGPNRLLWLTPMRDEGTGGWVDEPVPGLYRGFLDSHVPPILSERISITGFASVLCNAALLARLRDAI